MEEAKNALEQIFSLEFDGKIKPFQTEGVEQGCPQRNSAPMFAAAEISAPAKGFGIFG